MSNTKKKTITKYRKHLTKRQLNAFINKLIKPIKKQLAKVENELDKLKSEVKDLELSRFGLNKNTSEFKLISKKISKIYEKIEKLLEEELRLEEEQDFSDFHIVSDSVADCCGIRAISPLSPKATAKAQAGIIAQEMLGCQVRQVVITDIVQSKAWMATKNIAYPGPITKNYNSNNYVRHWTITDDMLATIAEQES